jgi:uncharacterized protein YjbJ (UPF0337 family)
MWNKDEVKGKIEQAKGSAKRVIGKAVMAPKLASEGQRQEIKGKIQEGYGTAKRKVGAAIKDISSKIKH